jgi:hypothetical protein
MAQWYYYFGGLADKIEAQFCRATRRTFSTYARRAAGRGGGDRAVELAAADRVEARAVAASNPSSSSRRVHLRLVARFMQLIEQAGFAWRGERGHRLQAEIGSALVEHPLVAKITLPALTPPVSGFTSRRRAA